MDYIASMDFTSRNSDSNYSMKKQPRDIELHSDEESNAIRPSRLFKEPGVNTEKMSEDHHHEKDENDEHHNQRKHSRSEFNSDLSRDDQSFELDDDFMYEDAPFPVNIVRRVTNTIRYIRYMKRRQVAILLITVFFMIFVIFTFLVAAGWYIYSALQEEHYEAGQIYLATGDRYAVASDHRTCSEIGLNILKMGGNAVDSAIATALCLGVLNSFSSGIGGGAIMLISEHKNLAKDGAKRDDQWQVANDKGVEDEDVHIHVINSREKAPAAAHRDMFVGKAIEAQIGSQAIAVPGEIRGMYTAWKKHGKIAWHFLVEPSIALARAHRVSKLVAERLAEKEEIIRTHPHLEVFREIYAPGGKLLKEGDIYRNERLARTLEIIAQEGGDTFYNGTLAKDIAQDIQDFGGLVTEEDLANYDVKEESPVCTYFLGYRVCTSPSEISGGSCNILALNILENLYTRVFSYNNDKSTKEKKLLFHHYTIEAMKWIFAHRMNLGDPEFVNVKDILHDMASKNYAGKIRSRISDTHTNLDFRDYAPLNNASIFSSVPNGGTTHLSVIDSEKRTVSVTSTINLYFGSMVVGNRTGILFNDEMDDFSIPGEYNAFNLPPSEYNFVAPGKRPLSSMSPMVVFKDSELYMSVGASGGPRIITATLQTVINRIVFGMSIDKAIASPRFHHQLLPTELLVDKEFDAETKAYFESLGHKIREMDMKKNQYLGVCQGIVVENGKLHAASDWRKSVGRAYAE